MLTSLMTREIERNKCTHSDGMSVLWIGVPLPWGGYKSEIAWTLRHSLVLGPGPRGALSPSGARTRFSLVTLLQRAHPHVSSESFDVLGFVFAITCFGFSRPAAPIFDSYSGPRPAPHANETRHATARKGRKSGTQLMKPSAATRPVRDGRTTCGRITSSRSKQTRPLTLLARNFSTRRLNAKKAHRMRRHTYKQRAAQ